MNKLLIVNVIAMILMLWGIEASILASFASPETRRGGTVIVADIARKCPCPKAPIATSGDNVYIAWPTNRTGNDEVLFRASTDGGGTFADKINLSNSTNAESQDVEIAAEGDNVIVTWWERNQTAEEPMARLSSDNGATFGPVLKLATNGTIGQAAAE